MATRTMTLDELATGMIAVLRNGDKCLVMRDFMNEESILLDNHSYISLDAYDDDMIDYDGEEQFDIMEVYEFDSTWSPKCIKAIQNDFDLSWASLLWKREEQVELTLEQVAEKFGIPVSQLRIKD